MDDTLMLVLRVYGALGAYGAHCVLIGATAQLAWKHIGELRVLSMIANLWLGNEEERWRCVKG